MTKERKLAIEMWKGIRGMLSVSDGLPPESILRFKSTFCEEHNLKWIGRCWFCQYIPTCDKCPLHDCIHSNEASVYSRVTDNKLDKGVRIVACNSIIKALMGGKI